MSSSHKSKELLNLLTNGIEQLRLEAPVSSSKIEKILKYVDLLIKWNKVYNITSITNPREIITKHILDSLSVVNHINNIIQSIIKNNSKKNIKILDVGSGGGLPGLVLAIVLDDFVDNLEINLLDSNNKKTSFLQQATIDLVLSNIVSVHNMRVEDYYGKNNIIISRAFASTHDFVYKTMRLLNKNGIILAMKSKKAVATKFDHFDVLEFNKNDKMFFVEESNVYKLKVPYLSEERYLVEIISRDNKCRDKEQR